MSRQLALDLPLRPSLGRGDFFVAPSNAAALASVEDWTAWRAGRLLLLGGPGAGKTHLAEVWRAMVPGGAQVVAGAGLGGADIAALAAGAVAVEDAGGVAGDAAGEAALLHLLNLAAAEGGHVLMTARRPPADWGVALPDLLSRLQATGVARLEPPGDALLSAVLVKLFADRQLVVGPALVSHLVARMERSLSAAAALVARLDRLALERRQAVTRALAEAALAEGDGAADG